MSKADDALSAADWRAWFDDHADGCELAMGLMMGEPERGMDRPRLIAMINGARTSCHAAVLAPDVERWEALAARMET